MLCQALCLLAGMHAVEGIKRQLDCFRVVAPHGRGREPARCSHFFSGLHNRRQSCIVSRSMADIALHGGFSQLHEAGTSTL